MGNPGLARQQVATAILAGGAARRLGGVDNGPLVLEGRPLVDWVGQNVGDRRSKEPLIVANRNVGRYARYDRVVVDAEPGFRGPLAGIAAALDVTESAWRYTLPLDCPPPPASLLDGLWRRADQNRCVALVAHDGIWRQPLFARCRSILSDSTARAVRADLGASVWQDSIAAVEVDFPGSAERWVNLNTGSEFEEFPGTRAWQ
jgi:molybdopterin-guanine dinucleotide biosynthesis protein A